MASEAELQAVRPRLLGLIDEERISRVRVERTPPELLQTLEQISDLSPAVSDALDELGTGGAVGATTLRPLVGDSRIVGPAITIRYVPESGSIGARVARLDPAKLADRDLYAIGEPGDVAVFDCGGLVGASVMGGLSAAWARRLQIAGCVVDGGVRDLVSIRTEGLPVWARAVTPVSGKHRLEAVEINGTVAIAGIAVRPGDVVVADDTGVCVVPSAQVASVVDICRRSEEAEGKVLDAMRRGATPAELSDILNPGRW